MRNIILCGLWITVVTLIFANSAYASSGTANGGNGGLGSGMGTGSNGMHEGISAKSYGSNMDIQSYDDGRARTNATPDYDVSAYGTGTGSQFWNVNANAPDTTNRSQTYRMQSYPDGGYRATATSSAGDGTGWAWLGLLGLLGLFGIRGRNPQRSD